MRIHNTGLMTTSLSCKAPPGRRSLPRCWSSRCRRWRGDPRPAQSSPQDTNIFRFKKNRIPYFLGLPDPIPLFFPVNFTIKKKGCCVQTLLFKIKQDTVPTAPWLKIIHNSFNRGQTADTYAMQT
jgi:hypothetical protein